MACAQGMISSVVGLICESPDCFIACSLARFLRRWSADIFMATAIAAMAASTNAPRMAPKDHEPKMPPPNSPFTTHDPPPGHISSSWSDVRVETLPAQGWPAREPPTQMKPSCPPGICTCALPDGIFVVLVGGSLPTCQVVK